MTQYTRKRGMNRGSPRLWLEGKILTEAGFARGDLFNIEEGTSWIKLIKHAEGKRKVSGKADKPIIDIIGKALGPLIETDLVTITSEPGQGILICHQTAQGDE